MLLSTVLLLPIPTKGREREGLRAREKVCVRDGERGGEIE